MIVTATIVMNGRMYLNTYALDHVWFSETRAYMAIVMGATMAVIMLGFMLSMYDRRGVNLAILAGSIVVFVLALWLVRSQQTVDQVSYMKAMIPHHSIAIMTSRRAHIKDPRVRELADGIIIAQEKEIAEMERLIADLERNPAPQDAPDLPPGARQAPAALEKAPAGGS
jgi:Na+/proline symporter